jgi:hypothetical protein
VRGRATEQLIAQLAHELEPVRRLPPLRRVALAWLGVWAAGIALSWLLGGAGLRLTDPGGLGDPIFAAIFAALGLAAAGGGVAVVARAVPGRERLARAGLAALGLGCAGAVGAAGLGGLGRPGPISPALALTCTAHAVGFALAPAAIGVAWLARAWETRPGRGALVASLAAAALGASAVHASCITGDAWHMGLGHALGPALVAVAGAWLARIWLAGHAAAR